MNSIDVELAKEQVATFLRLLRDNYAIYESAYGSPRDRSNRQLAINRARSAAAKDSTSRELLRIHPVIERIAEAVDPNEGRDRFKPRGTQWRWANAYPEAERLAGILEQQETLAAIFEPTGPRLQADRLHPWVWDAARNLWDDEHYGHAVHDATKAVERQTQIKLNRLDLDGKDLYAQAFSTKDADAATPQTVTRM